VFTFKDCGVDSMLIYSDNFGKSEFEVGGNMSTKLS